MEQSGVSTIAAPNIANNPAGKSKSYSVTLKSNGIMTAKEKLTSPWLRNLLREDATLSDIVLLVLAEIIGTAMLMCIGCTGCVGSLTSIPTSLQIAFTFGFAVMTAIQSVGHISGAHINPSITLASLIMGYKSLPMSCVYVLAQCVGALFGFGLIKVITPEDYLHAGVAEDSAKFCVTLLHDSVNPGQGLGVEILATGILSFFACAIWDARNQHNSDSIAMRFGFCVSVLCMAFGPYTGCSLNPARSLAPAIWNSYWDDHWVFWVGPLIGAAIASTLYRCVFQPKVLLFDSADGAHGI